MSVFQFGVYVYWTLHWCARSWNLCTHHINYTHLVQLNLIVLALKEAQQKPVSKLASLREDVESRLPYHTKMIERMMTGLRTLPTVPIIKPALPRLSTPTPAGSTATIMTPSALLSVLIFVGHSTCSRCLVTWFWCALYLHWLIASFLSKLMLNEEIMNGRNNIICMLKEETHTYIHITHPTRPLCWAVGNSWTCIHILLST